MASSGSGRKGKETLKLTQTQGEQSALTGPWPPARLQPGGQLAGPHQSARIVLRPEHFLQREDSSTEGL